MKMRTIAATTLAIAACASSTLPAHAALQTTELNGTVNCNGARQDYTTVRYLTGYSNASIYLKKAAHTDGHRGGIGKSSGMTLGVRIVKTSERKENYVDGADRWATFSTAGYLPRTAFTVSASMNAAGAGSGTCHNDWAGTLHY